MEPENRWVVEENRVPKGSLLGSMFIFSGSVGLGEILSVERAVSLEFSVDSCHQRCTSLWSTWAVAQELYVMLTKNAGWPISCPTSHPKTFERERV